MMPKTNQITALLQEFTSGDKGVVDAIMPLLYDELHKLAELQLRRERNDHTLNATALINEAYIKLVDQSRVNWQNRSHFMAISAVLMRRILVKYAEKRRALKRGGDQIVATFDEQVHQVSAKADELIALDEAMNKLKALNERQASVVEYWFFGGLNHDEISNVLKVSVPTVRRDWRLARVWLSRQLKNDILQ